MSAHVLLNLFNFNKLRKSDIIRGLLSILSLFRIEFNIFTNTGAQLFNRFYLSYDISIALKSHFWHEKSICDYVHNIVKDIIT